MMAISGRIRRAIETGGVMEAGESDRKFDRVSGSIADGARLSRIFAIEPMKPQDL